MDKDTKALKERLAQLVPGIKARFAVRRIGIFGSTVKGTHSPESDIDILVEFEEGGATFDNFTELIFYLEDKLEGPVDLVTTKGISPDMKPEIDRVVVWCEE
jgi:predicted nucleotidyltransferase